MITLLTRDGTKHGNAIIYGGSDGFDIDDIQSAFGNKPIFYVETDFGNRMKLTWNELTSMFIIGRVQTYDKWKQERAELIQQNFIADNPELHQ